MMPMNATEITTAVSAAMKMLREARTRGYGLATDCPTPIYNFLCDAERHIEGEVKAMLSE
jgi:hypothetical protein